MGAVRGLLHAQFHRDCHHAPRLNTSFTIAYEARIRLVKHGGGSVDKVYALALLWNICVESGLRYAVPL